MENLWFPVDVPLNQSIDRMIKTWFPSDFQTQSIQSNLMTSLFHITKKCRKVGDGETLKTLSRIVKCLRVESLCYMGGVSL